MATYEYGVFQALSASRVHNSKSVHIVKLKQYFTLSPGLFAVNEPKDAISVVHVNNMPATVS